MRGWRTNHCVGDPDLRILDEVYMRLSYARLNMNFQRSATDQHCALARSSIVTEDEVRANGNPHP